MRLEQYFPEMLTYKFTAHAQSPNKRFKLWTQMYYLIWYFSLDPFPHIGTWSPTEINEAPPNKGRAPLQRSKIDSNPSNRVPPHLLGKYLRLRIEWFRFVYFISQLLYNTPLHGPLPRTDQTALRR